MGTTDCIERSVLLKAPRARVWQALENAGEFGHWFGVDFQGARFVAGSHARGKVTQPGWDHLWMDVWIERVEPQRLLSWRWHPGAIDATADLPQAETTLVEFRLQDAPGGTLLTVVESGFDRVPPARRLAVFRENTEGWDAQMRNIAQHVAAS
mgnify:CR=1 FL=1|jgi:uncharacterized protein YndB with AHSA1/START domain